jgi:hypothetical protein
MMSAMTQRKSRARTLTSTRRSALPGQAMILSVLLLVQFFVGMITNLYVTIPDNHPGAGAKDFFSGAPDALSWAVGSGAPWLAFHAALGMALAFFTILFIITAVRAKDRLWIWVSVIGALVVIGAAFNGTSFLMYNHDFSSLIMAGLFALGLGTYLTGIYYSSRRTR